MTPCLGLLCCPSQYASWSSGAPRGLRRQAVQYQIYCRWRRGAGRGWWPWLLPAAPAAVPETPELPDLEASDDALLQGLRGLFTGEALQQYLVPNDIVRRLVVTIDNLPRKKVAERLKPLAPIEGKFIVTGPEEAPLLAPENFERYRALVQLVNITDTEQLAALYFRFYPLFQQSYQELGYPQGYFNNRVVEVIDHLLLAPESNGPIALTQPSVMYEFADPKLENLSAGQKVLVRIGPDNAAVFKKKLRELRAAVTKKPT
jgi:hypothetical protein